MKLYKIETTTSELILNVTYADFRGVQIKRKVIQTKSPYYEWHWIDNTKYVGENLNKILVSFTYTKLNVLIV